MDALTVRVEARQDTPTDRRGSAAKELVHAIKETVGVSVSCDVIDPDTLERSTGKLARIVDHSNR